MPAKRDRRTYSLLCIQRNAKQFLCSRIQLMLLRSVSNMSIACSQVIKIEKELVYLKLLHVEGLRMTIRHRLD